MEKEDAMPKNASQFALIEKIKSFVKNTGRFLGADDKSKITENMARKIQQTAYEKSLREIKDVYTPPYLALAKQLEVDNYQIFCATVFNMAEIAKNSSKHRREIIEIFEKVRAEEHRSPEMAEYVDGALKELKKLK